MTYKKYKLHDQAGFTIVELLVATAVLSVILTIVTVVMVGIGNLYYKGISQARVQDNVRSTTDEISQALQLQDGTQFSSVAPNAPTTPTEIVGKVCIGTVRYSYVLNKQIGSNDINGVPIKHVLWRDNVTTGGCDTFSNFWKTADPQTLVNHGTNGVELIAPHARLTSFSVSRATDDSPFQIKIGVAYGDGDLICNETVAGDCDANIPESDTGAGLIHHNALQNVSNPYDIICRGHLGDQFCATSALQTTVVKRLIKQG